MEFKVITYEERTLEFFNKQLKFSKQKLERIERKRFTNVVDRMTMLSEAGEEVSYYEDIVKMLEENVKNNHKKATTVANPDTPTKTDFKYFTADQVRNMSQKEVKENYQNIMKSMKKW